MLFVPAVFLIITREWPWHAYQIVNNTVPAHSIQSTNIKDSVEFQSKNVEQGDSIDACAFDRSYMRVFCHNVSTSTPPTIVNGQLVHLCHSGVDQVCII